MYCPLCIWYETARKGGRECKEEGEGVQGGRKGRENYLKRSSGPLLYKDERRGMIFEDECVG